MSIVKSDLSNCLPLLKWICLIYIYISSYTIVKIFCYMYSYCPRKKLSFVPDIKRQVIPIKETSL